MSASMTVREARTIAADCLDGRGDRHTEPELRAAYDRLIESGQWLDADTIRMWLPEGAR